jgi:hypothetical protein
MLGNMATPFRMAFALTLTALLGAPCTSIATDTDTATTQKIVSRLYQATFGASERCKMAPPESASEFKAEFDRFGAKYPELLKLLKAST